MAHCIRCDKSGFFLSVNKYKVCKSCDQIIHFDINQRGRIVLESIEVANKSKKPETKLSRLSLIKEHCDALIKYNNLGMTTLTPSPWEIINACDSDIEEIVKEYSREKITAAEIKADLAACVNNPVI
jgi:translation initiation factor 2 beta subunit (eIF-2beta)/eIF-5